MVWDGLKQWEGTCVYTIIADPRWSLWLAKIKQQVSSVHRGICTYCLCQVVLSGGTLGGSRLVGSWLVVMSLLKHKYSVIRPGMQLSLSSFLPVQQPASDASGWRISVSYERGPTPTSSAINHRLISNACVSRRAKTFPSLCQSSFTLMSAKQEWRICSLLQLYHWSRWDLQCSESSLKKYHIGSSLLSQSAGEKNRKR